MLTFPAIDATRRLNLDHGVFDAELSWLLERNERVLHMIELVDGVSHKQYGVFGKSLCVFFASCGAALNYRRIALESGSTSGDGMELPIACPASAPKHVSNSFQARHFRLTFFVKASGSGQRGTASGHA